MIAHANGRPNSSATWRRTQLLRRGFGQARWIYCYCFWWPPGKSLVCRIVWAVSKDSREVNSTLSFHKFIDCLSRKYWVWSWLDSNKLGGKSILRECSIVCLSRPPLQLQMLRRYMSLCELYELVKLYLFVQSKFRIMQTSDYQVWTVFQLGMVQNLIIWSKLEYQTHIL